MSGGAETRSHCQSPVIETTGEDAMASKAGGERVLGWSVFATWCAILLLSLTFSALIAEAVDTGREEALQVELAAQKAVDDASAVLSAYADAAEAELVELRTQFDKAEFARNNIFAQTQDPIPRANVESDFFAAKRRLENAEVRVNRIAGGDEPKAVRLKEVVAEARDRLSEAKAASRTIAKTSAAVSWLVKAFSLGAAGAALLMIFELYRARGHRAIDENPFAIILMMIAGGGIGVLAVSYLGSEKGSFDDIEVNISSKMWVVGMAMIAGLSWDVIIRSLRLLVERRLGKVNDDAGGEEQAAPKPA
jgi:hypothetical protein